MFDLTFFKFLLVFVVIIGTSFLIMGIASSFDSKTSSYKDAEVIILK